MDNLQRKEIGKLAYKKANRMMDGEVPFNINEFTINEFTIDELKCFLLTLDGMGIDFKIKVLDELIGRAYDQGRDGMMPPL